MNDEINMNDENDEIGGNDQINNETEINDDVEAVDEIESMPTGGHPSQRKSGRKVRAPKPLPDVIVYYSILSWVGLLRA